MPRGRRQVGSVALALLLIGACGGTQEPEEAPSSSSPPVPTDEVSVAEGVTLPETRAGQAAAWVLEQLAADEGPFKDGSAPGEMAGSWYLGSADGEEYAVVVQIAATDVAAVPDAGWMAGVVGQTAEVLAEEE